MLLQNFLSFFLNQFFAHSIRFFLFTPEQSFFRFFQLPFPFSFFQELVSISAKLNHFHSSLLVTHLIQLGCFLRLVHDPTFPHLILSLDFGQLLIAVLPSNVIGLFEIQSPSDFSLNVPVLFHTISFQLSSFIQFM
eukprot:08447.XXX_487311_487718_1 [CDS] Oithona nana genome sequencing.